MTPIEKNDVLKSIIVVDEQGKKYEATYPKRAKGLVKNGRARFVDEHTICLLSPCPPTKIESEDIKMSENIKKTNGTNEVTLEMIFGKISELQAKMTDPMNSSLQIAHAISCANRGDHGVDDDEAYSDIIADITSPFCLREENYRHLIELYNKMLDIVSNRQQLVK